MADSKLGHLSARGSEFADPSNRPVVLDILSNLWHPDSNPDGYISLGVAENVGVRIPRDSSAHLD